MWAWSSAVATRGVDQAGNHTDGSVVMTNGGPCAIAFGVLTPSMRWLSAEILAGVGEVGDDRLVESLRDRQHSGDRSGMFGVPQ